VRFEKNFLNLKHFWQLFIFIVISSSLTSCAGGSRGTGILTMRVSVRLQNIDGQALSNTPLLVETSASSIEDATNLEGEFETEIFWRFERPVNFTFGNNDPFPIDQIPEDTSLLETVWQQEESGELVPVSVNFVSE